MSAAADRRDRIDIIDLRVSGIIGINPDERINEQEILVNVSMWADTRRAAESDSIDDAGNERTISEAIITHIRDGKPMLVERLVAEIGDRCLSADGRIEEVAGRVEKPGALRHARSVGVAIHRSRA